jgi:hypothetical protein
VTRAQIAGDRWKHGPAPVQGWPIRFASALLFCTAAGTFAAPAAGQGAPACDGDCPAAPADWQVPRTSWGDPDLSGAWPVDHLAHVPRQRPPQMGTRTELTDAEYAEIVRMAQRQIDWRAEEDAAGLLAMGHWIERSVPPRQTSMIVEPANGRYPALTPEGERLAAADKNSLNNDVFDWIDDFGTFDRCITRGMPNAMMPGNYNSGIEIHQAPGLVAIRLELVHEARLIHLDGRAPPPPEVQSWLGFSTGRWEGDTLVIETSNFLPGASSGPAPNSTALKVTERLTPTGPDTMHYEAWIEDPVVLTAPYKIAVPWQRQPEYVQYEYACHEGNRSIRDYITATGSRFAEQRARAFPAGE